MSYFYAYSALSSRGLFKVVDLDFGSVEYFNYSLSNQPTLVFKVLINGSSVNFTVSLSALNRLGVSIAGYLSGFGSASMNLSIIKPIASCFTAYSPYVWPSLIAFVTRIANGETWTAVVTIPYDPNWVIEGRPISIVVIVNLGLVKPVKVKLIRVNSTGVVNDTPVAKPGFDPYGYAYLGNCNGSELYYVENNAHLSGWWYLVDCKVFEWPLVQFFIDGAKMC
jgi:hypothetical protein